MAWQVKVMKTFLNLGCATAAPSKRFTPVFFLILRHNFRPHNLNVKHYSPQNKTSRNLCQCYRNAHQTSKSRTTMTSDSENSQCYQKGKRTVEKFAVKKWGGVFELSFNNTDLLIETCNYFCAFATKKGFFSSHIVFWKSLYSLCIW